MDIQSDPETFLIGYIMLYEIIRQINLLPLDIRVVIDFLGIDIDQYGI